MSITLSDNQAEAIEDLLRGYEIALDNILYKNRSVESTEEDIHACQAAQRWLTGDEEG